VDPFKSIYMAQGRGQSLTGPAASSLFSTTVILVTIGYEYRFCKLFLTLNIYIYIHKKEIKYNLYY